MRYDILTIGFPLVEIMRKEKDVPFDVAADFTGPYPSGDTCIVLDVAARLGRTCCMFGVAGEDAFGRVIINRMKADGIDTKYIRLVKDYSTAAVFVRYDKNGEREYMDFIHNSACSLLNSQDIVPEVIAASKWIHFSGEIISNCIDPVRRSAIRNVLNHISKESKVSLDPNFTIELNQMDEIMKPFIERADVILPSEGEAKWLMNTKTDDDACKQLAAHGKIVALKRGKLGCDIYHSNSIIHIDPFSVEEVDPTGCGDSFCAGFITALLKGWSLEKAGVFANATGALQATALGPMEGAKYYEEVINFIKQNLKTDSQRGDTSW